MLTFVSHIALNGNKTNSTRQESLRKLPVILKGSSILLNEDLNFELGL